MKNGRTNSSGKTTNTHVEKTLSKSRDTFGKDKEKQMLKEVLLLPSTSIGKTTSTSIAERSNVWAENKLDEVKTALDQKLHKSIVKINSDRLEVVNELASLKKSLSTGALDRLYRHEEGGGHTRNDKVLKSGQSSPNVFPKHDRYSEHGASRNSSGKKLHSGGTLVKKSDNSAKVAIIIGADSSSDESDDMYDSSSQSLITPINAKDDGKADHKMDAREHANHQSNLSLTASLGYRGCMADRSQSQMVENVSRRFAKQLSGKSKTREDEHKIEDKQSAKSLSGKSKTNK